MSGPEAAPISTTARPRRDRPRQRAVALAQGSGGRAWRWAAVPFAVTYLVLLGVQFGALISTTNLDADTVSAPVIGELFGSAPAHAGVVLGQFGWYATLLFELATKWLPFHRQIWEVAPYAMALGGAALTAWSVWQVAGRWAASITAVLLICAAPATLHLLLSMTQHAPDWFCLGLLAAFLMVLERRGAALRSRGIAPFVLIVGAIVGVNAASDPLLVISGLVPFGLALLSTHWLARGPHSAGAVKVGLATLAVVGVTWVGTDVLMAALNVAPESGIDTTVLAGAGKIGANLRLWWQSIAVLGNGDFFAREVTFASVLAVACAALSIAAVVALPRAGWLELRTAIISRASARAPARLAFMVFWCSSASLLTLAFVLSATPVDIHADRYLVGLVYAAAAVIPVLAAARIQTQAVVLAGACIFALSGVISMGNGTVTRNTEGFPTTAAADQIARIAATNHLRIGYAGYWDSAPITWSTGIRVQVNPVSVCDQNAHLCRFDLHVISSWYTPRPGARSFLLTDPSLSNLSSPTPDLGPPTATYRIGKITMYVYPYDLASKIRRS